MKIEMEIFFKILLIPCWIWVWVSPIVGLVFFVVTLFRTDAKTAVLTITTINILSYTYPIGGFLFYDEQVDGFFSHINIVHYWMFGGLLVGLLPLLRLLKK